MIEINATLKRPDFTLDVALQLDQRVTAIFGPSGSGKSTLLSIIAGISKPDQGRVMINGEAVFDDEKKINKPIHQRRIGLVFQDARLFPHLNVEHNLRYPLKFTPTNEQQFHFNDIINLLEIGALLKRTTHQLSGGEKQRVALGRALLSSPRLLMLDEPMASLDESLKSQILPFLKKVADEINIPMIYISHSKDEIMQITNNMVYINAGKIVA
ncbi:molybdenum ABC transporter ATP-binding protein [Methylotenera mobilis]|uniref:ABC transporter related n=1 Tax=Methylotenera mobilis (strain JLW8 / ATCC BAA-1282 / DSM 17540) TaxID=583345 RepID=C6WZ84_METML|nr:molybdenum ABC transporter ATP-binding protein [Methylotenera mobilis]ACT49032.1 ABC transporter related [Methylotenera mobilis JLW8]